METGKIYKYKDSNGKLKFPITVSQAVNHNGQTLADFLLNFSPGEIQVQPVYIDTVNTEVLFTGKTILLAGDSRSSTDYSFYGTTLSAKTGANILVKGASGASAREIASNNYFTRLTDNPHDYSIWIVGGNEVGNSGTVGTFKIDTINHMAGEPIVLETDISIDYNGTTFIQAISHIIRKYKNLFYDFKTLNNGKKPKMIMCTDLPQKRYTDYNAWSLKENWERKVNAIIECCDKYNITCLDLYKLCCFDMTYEPCWTSPTNFVDDNGIYYMDGLHPNQYGIDVITSHEVQELKKHILINQ